MQLFTANEAKTRFGEFLDRVQREPGLRLRLCKQTISADE
jgi:hypothetical protein